MNNGWLGNDFYTDSTKGPKFKILTFTNRSHSEDILPKPQVIQMVPDEVFNFAKQFTDCFYQLTEGTRTVEENFKRLLAAIEAHEQCDPRRAPRKLKKAIYKVKGLVDHRRGSTTFRERLAVHRWINRGHAAWDRFEKLLSV